MVKRMKGEKDDEIMSRIGASSASYTPEGRLVLDGVVVYPEGSHEGIDPQSKGHIYKGVKDGC